MFEHYFEAAIVNCQHEFPIYTIDKPGLLNTKEESEEKTEQLRQIRTDLIRKWNEFNKPKQYMKIYLNDIFTNILILIVGNPFPCVFVRRYEITNMSRFQQKKITIGDLYYDKPELIFDIKYINENGVETLPNFVVSSGFAGGYGEFNNASGYIPVISLQFCNLHFFMSTYSEPKYIIASMIYFENSNTRMKLCKYNLIFLNGIATTYLGTIYPAECATHPTKGPCYVDTSSDNLRMKKHDFETHNIIPGIVCKYLNVYPQLLKLPNELVGMITDYNEPTVE